MWSPFPETNFWAAPRPVLLWAKKRPSSKIKSNPMTRALRIDKMTLAALEATLKLYRDESAAVRKIPTLRMLTMPYERLQGKGRTPSSNNFETPSLATMRTDRFHMADMDSRPGGGSYPGLKAAHLLCMTLRPKSISVSEPGKKTSGRVAPGHRTH